MTQASPHSEVRAQAVGYLRRSTDRQEQSIPDQKKALQQYANAQGIRLVDFYTDDAISGTSTLGRRAFQRMIEDAQKPNRVWNSVLVYDVKRFGRVDNDEAGYYRHVLRQQGVQVLYVSENFTGDGTDDLLRPVKQWQAREESKDLSKVTIRGLLSRVQGGWWMGGAPPLGYDLRYENDRGEFLFTLRHLPDGSKQMLNEKGIVTRNLARGESLSISKRDRAKLIPGNPEKGKIVQDIFKMYVEEGKGYRAIVDALNRQDIPSPRGKAWAAIYSGKWATSSVREILLNPVYVGDSVWNRRSDGRFHRISGGAAVPRAAIHSRRLVPNDRSDWIRIKGTHQALVPHHLFEEAHKRRGTRGGDQKARTEPTPGGWSGSRSRFILSGLLFCGACGKPYHGCFKTKGRPRNDGTQIRSYGYNCSGFIRCGKDFCRSRTVSQDKIEGLVTQLVLDYYKRFLGASGQKLLDEAIQEVLGTTQKDVAKACKRALAEQRQIQKKINNLLDSITPENKDLVNRRLNTLRCEFDECSASLEKLGALANSQSQVREAASDAVKFLGRLGLILSEGVPEEKRIALRRCVEKVSIANDGENVTVSLRHIPILNARLVPIEGKLPLS